MKHKRTELLAVLRAAHEAAVSDCLQATNAMRKYLLCDPDRRIEIMRWKVRQ